MSGTPVDPNEFLPDADVERLIAQLDFQPGMTAAALMHKDAMKVQELLRELLQERRDRRERLD